MTNAALAKIKNWMTALNIDYEFGGWSTNPVPDPYFIGEYTEPESLTKEEDGYQESTFILTGTGTTWIDLQNSKSLIEQNIPKPSILPDKGGMAIYYSGSFPVPTGDANLKRIQINLTIKEWSVN